MADDPRIILLCRPVQLSQKIKKLEAQQHTKPSKLNKIVLDKISAGLERRNCSFSKPCP